MSVSWKVLLGIGAVAIAFFGWFINPARAPRERPERSTSTRSSAQLVTNHPVTNHPVTNHPVTNYPVAQKEVTTEDMPVIVEFLNAEEADLWRSVDDEVMGGVSQSTFSITEQNTGVFSGELSLENNGGFASVRRNVEAIDFETVEAIALRVKGDGRSYQLRLQTATNDSISYRAAFETTADEWLEVRIPLLEMEPVFRGRVIADAPKLAPSEIKQLGFLLADKQPGTFRLEVDKIQAI